MFGLQSGPSFSTQTLQGSLRLGAQSSTRVTTVSIYRFGSDRASNLTAIHHTRPESGDLVCRRGSVGTVFQRSANDRRLWQDCEARRVRLLQSEVIWHMAQAWEVSSTMLCCCIQRPRRLLRDLINSRFLLWMKCTQRSNCPATMVLSMI